MASFVRPLSADDADALRPLDQAYAGRSACEELIGSGSVSFYARSGHAFVLEEDGRAKGFLLGQAVWDGRRPTVLVRRVVASPEGGRELLLAAVTKSAYDSGVYDIVVEQPEADEAGRLALAASEYRPRQARLYERTLGSRSRTG
jgi:exonuclease VII large subunit